MAMMITILIWSLVIAASSAQTSIGPVVFAPMLVDVSGGLQMANLSCQFTIDGSDGVGSLDIQYVKNNSTDSVVAQQFRCIADFSNAIDDLPSDNEFIATPPLVINGCSGLSVASRVFTTQVATLWVTIPFSSITNSRFWFGLINTGTFSSGPVSELNIVGMAPVLAIAQQPCTNARNCISYNVEASVMATPSVSMSLVCGGLTAENSVPENFWTNQTLVVPITTPLHNFSCTVSVDGIQLQMKTETIDYEAHSCPCEEYVLNTTAPPLSACYNCSGCTYKWYTNGSIVNGETGENLSFYSYVTDVGPYAFTSETCDRGTCVNKTVCINATLTPSSTTGTDTTTTQVGPPPDMNTVYIAIGVVLGLWALLKLEWVVFYALCWAAFLTWKNGLRGGQKIGFYVLCCTGGVFIQFLCSKGSGPPGHTNPSYAMANTEGGLQDSGKQPLGTEAPATGASPLVDNRPKKPLRMHERVDAGKVNPEAARQGHAPVVGGELYTAVDRREDRGPATSIQRYAPGTSPKEVKAAKEQAKAAAKASAKVKGAAGASSSTKGAGYRPPAPMADNTYDDVDELRKQRSQRSSTEEPVFEGNPIYQAGGFH